MLLLISLLAACAAPAKTTQTPISSTPATATRAPTSVAPMTTPAAAAKPQGELVAGLASFGNENFLPWKSDRLDFHIGPIILYPTYDLALKI